MKNGVHALVLEVPTGQLTRLEHSWGTSNDNGKNSSWSWGIWATEVFAKSIRNTMRITKA